MWRNACSEKTRGSMLGSACSLEKLLVFSYVHLCELVSSLATCGIALSALLMTGGVICM